MKKGGFIVVEGIDGAGTTTQAELLADALRRRDLDVVLTREPTDRAVGALIRAALQHRLTLPSGAATKFSPSTLALLFAADRLDHIHHVIEPAVARGAIVVSDRYDLSSLIYQSATDPAAEGALDWLRSINGRALRPDLTVVLDLPAEVAEQRRRKRGAAAELFEQSALQKRLADLYARAEQLVLGDRVVHVSGDRSPEAVHSELLEVVSGVVGVRGAQLR